jgi:hypothetical protein
MKKKNSFFLLGGKNIALPPPYLKDWSDPKSYCEQFTRDTVLTSIIGDEMWKLLLMVTQ